MGGLVFGTEAVCPLVGVKLDGATLAEVDVRGGLGAPTWGPLQFLADLELRLGLPPDQGSPASRIAAWRERLEEDHQRTREPFYARSYAIDPLGTAEMLLEWRDLLVDAGWDGDAVPDGGPRLDTFVRLEAIGEPLPRGTADRLAAVEAALLLHDETPYRAITFAHELRAWPGRWRRIFAALELAGTSLVPLAEPPPCAAPTSDLGRLQAWLARGVASEPVRPAGDGSLLLLESPTPHDAAATVAAILRDRDPESYAIVRSGEHGLLDTSLARQGIATLGSAAKSAWRAPMQLLPILVDLAFEPVDPQRMLELFDLHVSPFPPALRHPMARALCDAPGLGDVRWEKEKRRLADLGQPTDVLDTWLEGPRFDPRNGVPRSAILSLGERIRTWLRTRMGGAHDELLAAAHQQCADFELLVARDPRPALDHVAVRRLVDVILAGGTPFATHVAAPGRPGIVDDPAALLIARPHVVWWHFVAEAARAPHRARWRQSEIEALTAAGVDLVDPMHALEEETRAWRRVALRAERSLILVYPQTCLGQRPAPHPFWDEITARLRLDAAASRRLVASSDDALARRRWNLDVEALPRLELPASRTTWSVPAGSLVIAGGMSPRALQHLLECPLRWVLGSLGAIRSATVPAIPTGPHLAGIIGHRLIEVLVENDRLTGDAEHTHRALDVLLPRVGAPLLQPGMNNERHQLRHQLVLAVDALARSLRGPGLAIASSEEDVSARWMELDLQGRLDLRVVDRGGRHAVIDFKWGRRAERERLAHGRAIQLALYACMVARQHGLAALPATAYFSLSRAQMLSTDDVFGPGAAVEGPVISETLTRLETTLPLVRRHLAQGRIPVTGVAGAEPLLRTLGVAEDARASHFDTDVGEACAGCAHGPICGRAWEGTW